MRIAMDNIPVLVFNSKGKLLAEYPSVKAVAEEFQCCDDTIKEYINNGKLWKKKKVFLDFAL